MKCIAFPDNSNPEKVVMAPDSAVIYRGNPWFLPSDGDSAMWTAQIFIGAVISRLGMNINPRFARRYFTHIALAVHPQNPTTYRDIEWIRDGAVVKGNDVEIESLSYACEFVADNFRTAILQDAIINKLISAVCRASAFATLKTGDFIMVPMPISPINIAEKVDFQASFSNFATVKFKTR